jgi:hypothetical protein
MGKVYAKARSANLIVTTIATDRKAARAMDSILKALLS